MFEERETRKKREDKDRIIRKKVCRFCQNKVEDISYLDYQVIRRCTTERGKILPARITGTCSWHQRHLANAVKRARHAGLMPYIAE